MRHPAHPDSYKGIIDRICYDPATIAFVALSAFKATSATSAARKEAKATIAEGNIVAANKAKEVARKAATQRVSFLNSGLTLEGTPMNVIDSGFAAGLEDINQIRANYNTRAKNQISAGRTSAISALASGFGSAAIAGGFGDFFGPSANVSANPALGEFGPFDNSLPWRNSPIG